MALEFFFDGYQTIPAYSTNPSINKLFSTRVIDANNWVWVNDPLGPSPEVSMEWKENGAFFVQRLSAEQRLHIPQYVSTDLPPNDLLNPGSIAYETDLMQFVGDTGVSWVAIGGGAGGGGIQSLNGQTGLLFPDQFFINDANVAISSGGGNHFIGWSGYLPLSRGGLGVGVPGALNTVPKWTDGSGGIAFDDTCITDDGVDVAIPRRLILGSLPLGTLAPGPLVTGLVAPDGTGMQAGLFQTTTGTNAGEGLVTLGADNVAVSGWAFRGADGSNPLYGGNFGVHFLGPGQVRGVEIDVQNEWMDTGIGDFGHNVGLWLNRSGTFNSSSAIEISSQDERGWWFGIHFDPGDAGTGGDTLIKGWGMYAFRAMPDQYIGFVPSDDLNPDNDIFTLYAFDETTKKAVINKRGQFLSRGADTGVTNPAFTFIDENDTGMYQPATNQLGFAVDGSEILKAVNSGGIQGTVTHGYMTSFGTTFASLGAVINGAIIYCSDCTQTNPCAGGGTGAFAEGINAAWSCTSGAGAGTVTGGGTGASTRVAVWTNTTNIIGYTDFTWDDANRNFVLGPSNITTAVNPEVYVIGHGNDVTSAGFYTFVIGHGNSTDGGEVYTLGNNNVMMGANSSGAYGNSNTISAGDSYAYGEGNNVSGSDSSAFGENNTVSGSDTHVFGELLNDGGFSDVTMLGEQLDLTGNPIGQSSTVYIWSGDVNIQGLFYPTADTVAGEVIMTDGAGRLSLQPLGTGGLSGAGVAKQIAVWSGATTQTGFADFIWDEVNHLLIASHSNTVTGTETIVLGDNNSVTSGSAVYILGHTNTTTSGDNFIVGLQNDLTGAGTSGAFGSFNDLSGGGGCGNCWTLGDFNNLAGGTVTVVGNSNTATSGSTSIFGFGNTDNGGGTDYLIGDSNTDNGGGSNITIGSGNTNLDSSTMLIGINATSSQSSALQIGMSTTPEVTITPGNVQILEQANGQSLNFGAVTENLTILAAATTDTAIQIPANTTVMGVSVRVTTVIPTAATFDVGVAGATTRYGTGVSTAGGTTNVSPGTTSPSIYTAATSIRITPNLIPAAATGTVRVTVHYISITAPTS